jgi:membrane dipeptidase
MIPQNQLRGLMNQLNTDLRISSIISKSKRKYCQYFCLGCIFSCSLIFMILLLLTLFSISIEFSVHKLPLDPIPRAKLLLDLFPLVDASNQFPYLAQQVKNSNFSFTLNLLNITKQQQEEIKSKLGKYIQTDYSNLQNGIFTAVLFNIFVPCDEKHILKHTLEQIDYVNDIIRTHNDKFLLATSQFDIYQAFYERKIAVLIGIDGGHMLLDSIAILRSFYSLGVRKLTLTRKCSNNISNMKFENEGLTQFGKDVLKEMNKFDMMIDLGHASDETMREASPLIKKIMISRSNVYNLCQHPNNLKDEFIDLMKNSNGLILISFESFHSSNEEWNQIEKLMKMKNVTNEVDVIHEFNEWKLANPTHRANVSRVVDHIDYIKKRIGVDYVGLGSDFDGVLSLPNGMNDCSDILKIVEELVMRGYSNEEIKKITSSNFMRFLKFQKV